MIVSEREFADRRQLLEIATQQTAQPRPNVLITFIYPSTVERAKLGQPGGMNVATRAQRWKESRPRLARVIAIGKNVVIHIRERNGELAKTVLQGDDPTEFGCAGQELKVVSLVIQETVPLPSFEAMLVSKQDLSTEEYKKCAETFAGLMGSRRGVVYFRSDTWFSDLPLDLFSVIPDQIPSSDDRAKRPETMCFVSDRWGLNCQQYGRH